MLILTYIDAISAIDRVTKNIPQQTTKNIQIAPAGPPLLREIPMILPDPQQNPTCGHKNSRQGKLPRSTQDGRYTDNREQVEISLPFHWVSQTIGNQEEKQK
jgi:hypothetical protein